jgi:hypothetical protein
MSLLPLFQWAARAPLFAVMRDSKWGFATVEMVHLLALAALGGTLLVVDLGILGIGFRRQPPSRVARELAPIFYGSLIAMVLSGALLVCAEALKCYYHPAFRLKMALFGLAVLFTFTVHRSALRITAGRSASVWSKAAAIVSLTLWLGVGLAGRAIGFL